jgi:hypothetical protein
MAKALFLIFAFNVACICITDRDRAIKKHGPRAMTCKSPQQLRKKQGRRTNVRNWWFTLSKSNVWCIFYEYHTYFILYVILLDIEI